MKSAQEFMHWLEVGAGARWIRRAAVLAAIRRGVRSRDPLLAAVALGAGGGGVAMVVHSLFDFNLQLPSNALLFLLLSAMISLAGERSDNAHPA